MGNQGCNGGVGDHICIAPHFIVSEDEIETIVSVVTKSVGEIVDELKETGEL